MKMIFVTGSTGDVICVASDNICYVDVAADKSGAKLINKSALYFRQTVNPNAAGIILDGTPKEVGLRINKQLEEFGQ